MTYIRINIGYLWDIYGTTNYDVPEGSCVKPTWRGNNGIAWFLWNLSYIYMTYTIVIHELYIGCTEIKYEYHWCCSSFGQDMESSKYEISLHAFGGRSLCFNLFSASFTSSNTLSSSSSNWCRSASTFAKTSAALRYLQAPMWVAMMWLRFWGRV